MTTLRLRYLAVALCGALAVAGATPAMAQIAQAVVLEGITIDGDLSDWPEDMKRYPMRTKVIDQGSGLEHANLDHSADLSPEFRVGYDPQKNLVYIAVEVRDDQVVIGNNYNRTDACPAGPTSPCSTRWYLVPAVPIPISTGGIFISRALSRPIVARAMSRSTNGRSRLLRTFPIARCS